MRSVSKQVKKALNEDYRPVNIKYNVGDYVYIKLPDTRVFKAQIMETSYNPKIKSDKSIKIGNIVKEAII